MKSNDIEKMLTTIILSIITAITGTFSIVTGWLLFKRKHNADAATVEFSNEKQIREIYKPIIDDLRGHIDEENKRCAEKLAEVYKEVDSVKGRLRLIEQNCINGCFANHLKTN
jgi:hypothetical protein